MPRARMAIVVGLFAATFASYGSATRSAFIGDDQHVIQRGRLIGDLRNLPELFVHNAMWTSYGETSDQKCSSIPTGR